MHRVALSAGRASPARAWIDSCTTSRSRWPRATPIARQQRSSGRGSSLHSRGCEVAYHATPRWNHYWRYRLSILAGAKAERNLPGFCGRSGQTSAGRAKHFMIITRPRRGARAFIRLLLLVGCAGVQAQSMLPEGSYAQLHWRLLGPFRGGWATMAAGVAGRPDTFYFGAAGGGVWKTVNAGRTWTSVGDELPPAIGALAVARTDPDTIYVGTGQPEPRYDISSGRGLYKSTDGGKSWAGVGLEATRHIGAIWIDPRDANVVVVAA